MTLAQLQALLAVVEYGSFRRAAKELGVSQAGLTTSVQALEHSLDSKLLVRTSSGVSLTALGKRVIVRAQTISRELNHVVQDAREFKGSPGGALSVGLGPTPTAVLLHLVVPEFHSRYPNVRLKLVSGFYEQLHPSLTRGEIELAVTATPEGLPSPELERKALFRSELAVVARKGHPMGRSAKLADLSDCEWVLMGSPGGPGGTVTRFHEEQGLPAPRIAATCESATQLAALLQSTDWLAMMPAVMLERGLLGADVSRLTLAERPPTFENCILYKKEIELTAAARAFVSMSQSAARMIARSKNLVQS